MNFRILTTVALSTGFITLLVTGLLLYITPYSYFQSSLHVWSAVLVISGFIFHLRNNWTAYKRHISQPLGRRVLLITLIGLLPISYGLIADKKPVVSLIQFGEKLRKSSLQREGEYTHITIADHLGETSAELSLFIKAGAHYQSEQQPGPLGISYRSVPQMAVWLETPEGEYLETLYITSKIANSSFINADLFSNDVIRRPEALPVWGYRSGVVSSDGLRVPEAGSNEFDGLTAATPLGDQLLDLHPTLTKTESTAKHDKVKLFVEVNRSYDFNSYYSRDRFPDDLIYSGSGSSGQPSLIYSASIDLNHEEQAILKLNGRGHHSGKHGRMIHEMQGITTAKAIIDFAIVNVKPLSKNK